MFRGWGRGAVLLAAAATSFTCRVWRGVGEGLGWWWWWGRSRGVLVGYCSMLYYSKVYMLSAGVGG